VTTIDAINTITTDYDNNTTIPYQDNQYNIQDYNTPRYYNSNKILEIKQHQVIKLQKSSKIKPYPNKVSSSPHPSPWTTSSIPIPKHGKIKQNQANPKQGFVLTTPAIYIVKNAKIKQSKDKSERGFRPSPRMKSSKNQAKSSNV
jgi:hypothetical protein